MENYSMGCQWCSDATKIAKEVLFMRRVPGEIISRHRTAFVCRACEMKIWEQIKRYNDYTG